MKRGTRMGFNSVGGFEGEEGEEEGEEEEEERRRRGGLRRIEQV